MKQTHCCLKISPRETDFILGSNSPLQMRSNLPSGDWLPFIEFFERQMLNTGDTNGCVIFSGQEAFDAQVEQQIQAGLVPKNLLDFFTQNNYMDLGNDGLPHFHTSPRFLQILTGNGLTGNSTQDVFDAMRKYGCLPYRDLPVDATLTPEQYVDPSAITQVMKDKAQNFLAQIGGKNAIQYHFICNGSGNPAARMLALVTAPLCDGVNVGDNWNSVTPTPPPDGSNPGHCVMEYKEIAGEADVYDHYLPNPKRLINFPIWYSLQPIVKFIPPPPVIPPAPTSTIQQNPSAWSAWIQSVSNFLSNWLQRLSPEAARLQGGKRSPKWSEVEKAFVKLNPDCKVCGTTKNRNVHHIAPFHLNPDKELDPANLITLCRVHHLLFGHFMNWSSFNTDVRTDAATWNTKIKGRP